MTPNIISGYVNDVISNKVSGNMKEKIVRIYTEDKKAINRDKMLSYLNKIMAKKKQNQNFIIRLYTDRGWRSIKKISSDTINWDDEEEYLRNRHEGSGEAFKEVYFVDFYTMTNL